MELVDLDQPTYTRGTAKGKFLFAPGACTSATFLQPSNSVGHEAEQLVDTPYYPAGVLDYTHSSGHISLLIPPPSETGSMGGQQDPQR